jgi:hypothetical protein
MTGLVKRSDFLSSNIPQAVLKRLCLLPAVARPRTVMLWGSPGAGKTRMVGRFLAWSDLKDGFPSVILDPLGGLLAQLLSKVADMPEDIRELLLTRIRVFDMSGKSGFAPSIPLYRRVGNESLYEASQRFPEVIRLSDASILTAPVQGWNAVYQIATHVGAILTALKLQLPEAQNLLQLPQTWEQRFSQAINVCPEVEPSVQFFKYEYSRWSRETKASQTRIFRTKMLPFLLDPVLKAICCGSSPSIDWQEIIDKRLMVIFDFSQINDLERRRFLSLWVLKDFLSFVKTRGAGYTHQPISLIIEELKYFFTGFETDEGDKAFAQEIIELLYIFARNMRICPVLITQDPLPFGEYARQALLSVGTHFVGPVHNFDAALLLARALIPHDPMKVKYWHPIYMNVTDYTKPIPTSQRSWTFQQSVQIVDYRPEFYALPEQEYNTAQRLIHLPAFHFLFRPALAEGTISKDIFHITIENMDIGRWPNPQKITEMEETLSRLSGRSVSDTLVEINARLPMALPVASKRILPDTNEKRRNNLRPPEDTSTDEDW